MKMRRGRTMGRNLTDDEMFRGAQEQREEKTEAGQSTKSAQASQSISQGSDNKTRKFPKS